MSENFNDTALTVGVMGLGYVGLPLAVHFAEAGNDVIALDVDHLKIEAFGAVLHRGCGLIATGGCRRADLCVGALCEAREG